MKIVIAGAGIGGLTTALLLHERGIECEIYEKVPELLQIGVGLALLPHAVRVYDSLRLLPDLDKIGMRTEMSYFRTRHGQNVWEERRGIPAGYDVPQYAIHRAHLQQVLVDAVNSRLPDGSLHLDASFEKVSQTDSGITALFRRSDNSTVTVEGDALIGADGIHSAVRHQFHPDEGAPRWSGLMLWRGAVEWPSFMDGKSYINFGGTDCKFVLYPISAGKTPETQLMNWATVIRKAEPSGAPPAREEWNRQAGLADIQKLLKAFTIPELDFEAMVAATPIFWEFPMCDRDTLQKWSFGRTTLLGDAAHSMYPFGANGAAQSILDGQKLADELAKGGAIADALIRYEADRLPKTNEIVANNRNGGPERVVNEVELRSPKRFDDVEKVLSYEDRKAIVHGYAELAGYAKEQMARS